MSGNGSGGQVDGGYVDWEIKGPCISTCNCDWGCPCQFGALPTHGDCRAAMGMRIETGHFGGVDLSGVTWCGMFAWPKAIHEGNGESFVIVDESSTPEQRNALFTILKGEECDPGATIFNVFAATFTKVHKPLFLPIEFELDMTSRKGRVVVDGILDAATEPLRNPVTNDYEYASVHLPGGFEYYDAEFASGTTTASGAIPQNWSQAHAHLYVMHMGPHGPVS